MRASLLCHLCHFCHFCFFFVCRLPKGFRLPGDVALAELLPATDAAVPAFEDVAVTALEDAAARIAFAFFLPRRPRTFFCTTRAAESLACESQ
jgi:hypothetical protein